MVRIRLERLVAGDIHPLSFKYIISYDPEHHEADGSYSGGRLLCTADPAQAAQLPIEEAFDLWRAGPSCECHRLRPDGERNRPLTIFNASFV